MKILHVLIMFGLLAANVVNGSALQRKLKKGKISNCSRFKTEIFFKKITWLTEIIATTKPRMKRGKPYL